MPEDQVQRVTLRELDALIGQHLFGMNIVGWTTCVNPEGSWSIHPDSSPKGWACFAEIGPVYVDKCQCQFAEEGDARFGGHITHCLRVVPHYTTDDTDTERLLTYFASRGRNINLKHMGMTGIWSCSFGEFECPKCFKGRASEDWCNGRCNSSQDKNRRIAVCKAALGTKNIVVEVITNVGS